MSQSQKDSASKIVETYKEKYPHAERQVLRKAIQKHYPDINTRTLDRHLKKAFSPSKPSTTEKETPREVTPEKESSSELETAQAITMIKGCQALTGYTFSQEEWQSVLRTDNGKSIVEKAKALTHRVYSNALGL